jgi:hypothetical protein
MNFSQKSSLQNISKDFSLVPGRFNKVIFRYRKKNLAANYLGGVQQVRLDAVSYYPHMHTDFKLTQ